MWEVVGQYRVQGLYNIIRILAFTISEMEEQ